eukprot:GEMP01006675.1.p1 GENE.GEMP01006675.1~~GEMP01006675.1.p1  ORF type:complete len:1014 (+),score=313.63 GEMP01006675.1:204-3245(+)
MRFSQKPRFPAAHEAVGNMSAMRKKSDVKPEKSWRHSASHPNATPRSHTGYRAAGPVSDTSSEDTNPGYATADSLVANKSELDIVLGSMVNSIARIKKGQGVFDSNYQPNERANQPSSKDERKAYTSSRGNRVPHVTELSTRKTPRLRSNPHHQQQQQHPLPTPPTSPNLPNPGVVTSNLTALPPAPNNHPVPPPPTHGVKSTPRSAPAASTAAPQNSALHNLRTNDIRRAQNPINAPNTSFHDGVPTHAKHTNAHPYSAHTRPANDNYYVGPTSARAQSCAKGKARRSHDTSSRNTSGPLGSPRSDTRCVSPIMMSADVLRHNNKNFGTPQINANATGGVSSSADQQQLKNHDAWAIPIAGSASPFTPMRKGVQCGFGSGQRAVACTQEDERVERGTPRDRGGRREGGGDQDRTPRQRWREREPRVEEGEAVLSSKHAARVKKAEKVDDTSRQALTLRQGPWKKVGGDASSLNGLSSRLHRLEKEMDVSLIPQKYAEGQLIEDYARSKELLHRYLPRDVVAMVRSRSLFDLALATITHIDRLTLEIHRHASRAARLVERQHAQSIPRVGAPPTSKVHDGMAAHPNLARDPPTSPQLDACPSSSSARRSASSSSSSDTHVKDSAAVGRSRQWTAARRDGDEGTSTEARAAMAAALVRKADVHDMLRRGTSAPLQWDGCTYAEYLGLESPHHVGQTSTRAGSSSPSGCTTRGCVRSPRAEGGSERKMGDERRANGGPEKGAVEREGCVETECGWTRPAKWRMPPNGHAPQLAWSAREGHGSEQPSGREGDLEEGAGKKDASCGEGEKNGDVQKGKGGEGSEDAPEHVPWWSGIVDAKDDSVGPAHVEEGGISELDDCHDIHQTEQRTCEASAAHGGIERQQSCPHTTAAETRTDRVLNNKRLDKYASLNGVLNEKRNKAAASSGDAGPRKRSAASRLLLEKMPKSKKEGAHQLQRALELIWKKPEEIHRLDRKLTRLSYTGENCDTIRDIRHQKLTGELLALRMFADKRAIPQK